MRPGHVTIIDESKNITSNLSFYEKHRKDLKHTTGSLQQGHVVLPGTPEHGTPEHRDITEHSGTPEKPRTPPEIPENSQENQEHPTKTRNTPRKPGTLPRKPGTP